VYVVLGSSELLIFVYEPDVVPRYTLYPLTEDVLAFHERLTVYCGETPVPLNTSVLFVLVDVVNVSVEDAAPLVVGANTILTDAIWPDFRVNGSERPESENCELLLDAEEIVTLPPVAVIVDAWVVELPMSTLPKLIEAGATVSWPLPEAPVPLSGMLSPGPGTKMLPLSAPELCGAKVTVRVVLWPLFRTRGRLGPLNEKPLPVVWNAVNVSIPDPVLVSETESAELLPTETDPNERLEGAAVIGSMLTPLAWKPIWRLEFDAVLVTVTSLPTHPVEVGEKLTVRLTLCPAATVTGKVKPETLIPEPFGFTAEIVMLVEPELVRVTDWLSDCPTTTDPNLMFDGELRSCGEVPRACMGSMATENRKVNRKRTRMERGLLLDWGSRM
jgi:hypothetical protein